MQPRLSLPEKTSTIWNEHERRSGLSTPFTKEGAPFQNLGAFLNKSNASSVPGQNASCRTAASVAAPSSKPDAMARKRRSAGASGRRSPATGHSSGLFPLVGRQRARQAQGCRRAQLASPLRRVAIDQGPIVVMIENHRTELLWKLFMNIPEIQRGMKALGFDSPYFTQRLGSRTFENRDNATVAPPEARETP
jgi:hypothetical protein